jgi:chromosome segregation ATPase
MKTITKVVFFVIIGFIVAVGFIIKQSLEEDLRVCNRDEQVLVQELTGKDTALARLNAQIAQLIELLSMEKTNEAGLEGMLSTLRASLRSAESERDRYKGLYEGLKPGSGKVEDQKQISTRASAQVELLNQQIAALKRQLAEALEASEKRDKEAQNRIAELGQRLNALGAASGHGAGAPQLSTVEEALKTAEKKNDLAQRLNATLIKRVDDLQAALSQHCASPTRR